MADAWNDRELLVQKLLDGFMTEQDRDALMRCLDSDPAFLDVYLDLVEMDVLLRREFNCYAMSSLNVRKQRSYLSMVVAAGVAILVLMGVTVALFNRSPPAGEGQWAHSPPVPFPSERCAIIEQVHFTGDHPVPTRLREMEDLQTGQEIFVEADVYAQLRFDRGARLLIRGPSRLTLEPNGVALQTGQLLGDIPSEAVGFAVHLGQALVRDLGTRFAVSYDGELTQVTTLDGKVQLELSDHQGQQQILPLVGGESAQMNPETGEFSRLAEVPVVLNDILAYDGGVVEIDGRMRYCLERPASIATPVSNNPGDVQFWLERIAVPFSTGVSLDIHPKGEQTASLLPRPRVVDSYLFRHRAPAPEEGLDSATGSVTFHQQIVGVISTSASLFQSDSAFAEERVALDWAKQPERTRLLRGTESRDELKISEDGRTLSFVLAANMDPKEFRVLVESGSAEEPDVPGEGLHFGKRDTNLHCVTYGAGHVWCGMASANSIVSIDPETMQQKSIPIKGSNGLHDLSFDGQDIWGVHSSGHITRLNPATGKVQTIKANGFAYTSHFDGRDIWVGMYTDPGQVLRLDRKTLQLETFVIPEAPKWSVRGLTSDGRRLWAALYTSPAMVAVVDPQTRSHQIVRLGTGEELKLATSMTFDGESIWVGLDSNPATIVKIHPQSLEQEIYRLHPESSDCRNLLVSKGILWAGLYTEPAQIVRLDLEKKTGEAITLPSSFFNTRDIASDGTNLWIGLQNVRYRPSALYRLPIDGPFPGAKVFPLSVDKVSGKSSLSDQAAESQGKQAVITSQDWYRVRRGEDDHVWGDVETFETLPQVIFSRRAIDELAFLNAKQRRKVENRLRELSQDRDFQKSQPIEHGFPRRLSSIENLRIVFQIREDDQVILVSTIRKEIGVSFDPEVLGPPPMPSSNNKSIRNTKPVQN